MNDESSDEKMARLNREREKQESDRQNNIQVTAIIGVGLGVLNFMYYILPKSLWYGTSDWGDILALPLLILAFFLIWFICHKIGIRF